MSGHSHAKTVKRVKDANAAKKGKIFSKISKIISLAAKNGDSPDFNTGLKQAIDLAKKANMPKENIERAIQKGAGGAEGEQLEPVLYEAIGPDNINLIIEGITDNKNRALAEIKQVLQRHNFKLASEGSVKWAFEQKGLLVAKYKSQINEAKTKEIAEMSAIEAGAEDIEWQENEEGEQILEITVEPNKTEEVKQNLEKSGFEVESSALIFKAKSKIKISETANKTIEKLIDGLDETETFQEFYSNILE